MIKQPHYDGLTAELSKTNNGSGTGCGVGKVPHRPPNDRKKPKTYCVCYFSQRQRLLSTWPVSNTERAA
jgi:hypothetical protein